MKLGEIIVVVLVVVALVAIAGLTHTTHEKSIKNWASQNGYTVEKIDSPWVDRGPFWYRDNEDVSIYKVVLVDKFENKRIAWFRFDWGMEQKWE